MMDMDMNSMSEGEISQFYDQKCAFVTGATGFMGKVLMHKLLHSCPGIEKIYILIRAKRGVEPQDRLDKLFEGPLYKELKEANASCFKKVIPITGDITLPRLGMSDEDITTLIENVSVIFHSAATVRFDEELYKSLIMNVEGTRSVIDLAKKMPKLKALVHVSTAYAHCNSKSTMSIDERFYRAYDNLEEVIAKCKNENLDDEEKIKLIGKYPNTYTFTKALAEQLLDRAGSGAQGLPIAIVRPSIVVASWEYPMKGWIDNYNGPTGVLAGVSTGLLRTMLVKRELVADVIPVDVCINVMIVAAWKTVQDYTASTAVPSIYNATSGSINPITWGELEDWAFSAVYKYPISTMSWYPSSRQFASRFATSNVLYYQIRCWLFLYIPAFLVDAGSTVLRQPNWGRKLAARMTKQLGVLHFFTLNQWVWSNSNLVKLHSALANTNSLKTFDFDIKPMDWKSFMENYWLGIRQFVFKDHPDTMEKSRKKLNIFYFLHSIMQLSLVFFVAFAFAYAIY